MPELTERHCLPCEGGTAALTPAEAKSLSSQVHSDWQLVKDGKEVVREFEFRNYYQTTAFVNAVAWIAHREDHHPDISFGYKQCRIVYSTHAIGGLSENDFICAAKIDRLLDTQE